MTLWRLKVCFSLSPTLVSTRAKGPKQCLWDLMNDWVNECVGPTTKEGESGHEVRFTFLSLERGLGVEGLGLGASFYSLVVWSLFHG